MPYNAHATACDALWAGLPVVTRRGHAFANGHVVKTALAAGSPLLLNSDGHTVGDLLSERLTQLVLRGAAVPESEFSTILDANPQRLLDKIGR